MPLKLRMHVALRSALQGETHRNFPGRRFATSTSAAPWNKKSTAAARNERVVPEDAREVSGASTGDQRERTLFTIKKKQPRGEDSESVSGTKRSRCPRETASSAPKKKKGKGREGREGMEKGADGVVMVCMGKNMTTRCGEPGSCRMLEAAA